MPAKADKKRKDVSTPRNAKKLLNEGRDLRRQLQEQFKPLTNVREQDYKYRLG